MSWLVPASGEPISQEAFPIPVELARFFFPLVFFYFFFSLAWCEAGYSYNEFLLGRRLGRM